MSDHPLRWGALGAARIVRRNWPAMLASGEAVLAGVAGRDPDRTRALVDEMQELSPWPEKPAVFESYETLLDCPDIDAVYIPLPTGVRKEWVIRAAERGKHVLCEKPCAVGTEDLLEMLDACRRNGVLFMDGVMFMHDPRFDALRELLDDGESVGEIRRISSSFSFRGAEGFAGADIRSMTALEPTGCLGDLGWYCLRASLWAMNWELPHRVSGRVLAESAGAIMEFSGELDFAGGVTSSCHCSFLAPDQMWLNISGTRGSIRIPDFVAPKESNDTDWENGYRRVMRSGESSLTNEARMFIRFAHDVRGGLIGQEWAEISLKTQRLLDACHLSAREDRPVFLERDPAQPDGIRYV